MLKNTFNAIILIVFLLTPAAADSQDMPAGKWWYNPTIQQDLNLSSNEIGMLDRLYAESRRRLIRLKSEVEDIQAEIVQVTGRKKANDAEVKKLYQRREKARRDLGNERLQYVIGVRNILGPDRFQLLRNNY